jgi:hypothetical protein
MIFRSCYFTSGDYSARVLLVDCRTISVTVSYKLEMSEKKTFPITKAGIEIAAWITAQMGNPMPQVTGFQELKTFEEWYENHKLMINVIDHLR